MYCANTIHIQAASARVFALGAAVEDWPSLLPHYRAVRVLGRRGRRTWLEMAARRGRLPVHWWAVQEVIPASYLITYRHVGGITRGMRVVWQLVPQDAAVELTIRHAFRPSWPLLGGWPAQLVVGRFFVQHIAGETLRHIKAHAEREERATRAPQP